MNDEYPSVHFDSIADERLKEVVDQRKMQRSERRAGAMNLVGIARAHAGRECEPYSQNEADCIMLMVELLDRVAES